jgi:hypothetical protein
VPDAAVFAPADMASGLALTVAPAQAEEAVTPVDPAAWRPSRPHRIEEPTLEQIEQILKENPGQNPPPPTS